MTATYLIGLDAGGTGARGVLATADGTLLARASRSWRDDRPGPAQPPRDAGAGGGAVLTGEGAGLTGEGAGLPGQAAGLVGGEVGSGVLAGLIGLVRALLEAGGVARARAVVLGTTGVSGLGGRHGETLPAVLAEAAGAEIVLVVSDALTSFVGALGLTGGAVVAAGTGAVVVGTDLKGTWRKVDGWGHLLGDVGGGAWIGRAGLDAALRHHDGRPGGSAALLAALHRRFGTPKALVATIYTRADRAGLLAGFVPDVVAAAVEEDAVAVRILSDAGRHLADAALAALPPRAPRVVAAAGNLVPAADLLSEAFTHALHEVGVDVRPARGTSAEGAVLLGEAALRDDLPPGLAESGFMISRR